jgi:ankyrin repeat protein
MTEVKRVPRIAISLAVVLTLVNCEKSVEHRLGEALSSEDLETARELIDRGADVNRQFGWPDGQMTLLMYSSAANHLEGVRFLLDNGADPDLRAERGMTALHFAAGKGHLESVEMLLEAGADGKVRDDHGETALDLAVQGGYFRVAELLRGVGGESPRVTRDPVDQGGG